MNRAQRRAATRPGRPRRSLSKVSWASCALAAATLTSSAVGLLAAPPPAGADPTSAALHAAQARATAIEAQVQSDGQRLEVLSQAVDGGRQRVDQLNLAVAIKTVEVGQEQAKVAAVRGKLHRAALQAYMDGSNASADANPLLAGSAQAAVLNREYTSVATSNLTAVLDQLRGARRTLRREQQQLDSSRQQAHAALATLSRDEQAAAATQQAQQTALSQVQGQVATLIHQQQVEQQIAQAMIFQAEQAAAARQAAAQLAAQQAAARRAAASAAQRGAPAGAPAPAPLVTPVTVAVAPPPVAQGAIGAVAAAESQIGVPYVWGGEMPGRGFDCSGLTQWAWRQAGVALPRTAQGQYDAIPHVPMSALQPGDLIFWNDGTSSVQHVAMYVGNGEVVQAPYTGASVGYSTIWTNGLVGAGRP